MLSLILQSSNQLSEMDVSNTDSHFEGLKKLGDLNHESLHYFIKYLDPKIIDLNEAELRVNQVLQYLDSHHLKLSYTTTSSINYKVKLTNYLNIEPFQENNIKNYFSSRLYKDIFNKHRNSKVEGHISGYHLHINSMILLIRIGFYLIRLGRCQDIFFLVNSYTTQPFEMDLIYNSIWIRYTRSEDCTINHNRITAVRTISQPMKLRRKTRDSPSHTKGGTVKALKNLIVTMTQAIQHLDLRPSDQALNGLIILVLRAIPPTSLSTIIRNNTVIRRSSIPDIYRYAPQYNLMKVEEIDDQPHEAVMATILPLWNHFKDSSLNFLNFTSISALFVCLSQSRDMEKCLYLTPILFEKSAHLDQNNDQSNYADRHFILFWLFSCLHFHKQWSIILDQYLIYGAENRETLAPYPSLKSGCLNVVAKSLQALKEKELLSKLMANIPDKADSSLSYERKIIYYTNQWMLDKAFVEFQESIQYGVRRYKLGHANSLFPRLAQIGQLMNARQVMIDAFQCDGPIDCRALQDYICMNAFYDRPEFVEEALALAIPSSFHVRYNLLPSEHVHFIHPEILEYQSMDIVEVTDAMQKSKNFSATSKYFRTHIVITLYTYSQLIQMYTRLYDLGNIKRIVYRYINVDKCQSSVLLLYSRIFETLMIKTYDLSKTKIEAWHQQRDFITKVETFLFSVLDLMFSYKASLTSDQMVMITRLFVRLGLAKTIEDIFELMRQFDSKENQLVVPLSEGLFSELIKAQAYHEKSLDAIEVICKKMKDHNVNPTFIIYSTYTIEKLKLGQMQAEEIHAIVNKLNLFGAAYVMNQALYPLIFYYLSIGDAKNAQSYYQSLKDHGNTPSLEIYQAFITFYMKHGLIQDIRDLVKEIQRLDLFIPKFIFLSLAEAYISFEMDNELMQLIHSLYGPTNVMRIIHQVFLPLTKIFLSKNLDIQRPYNFLIQLCEYYHVGFNFETFSLLFHSALDQRKIELAQAMLDNIHATASNSDYANTLDLLNQYKDKMVLS